MLQPTTPSYQQAIEDFKAARKQAALQQLLARLTGKSADLLAFEEISQMLQPTGMVEQGLQEIPLDAIVGSVGRYKDFTRTFLPKKDSDAERWARVKAAVMDMTGLPPIEVYKVGDVYFVKDGNHRVSVARQLGTPTISAYVTEVQTRVPLTMDVDPDELICKERYVEFLQATGLDTLRPDADLTMTFPGYYQLLRAQIEAYRQQEEVVQKRPLSLAEAVTGWYDKVYLPVVQLIREQGILKDFPDRTEADLYVLLTLHQQELKEALGWDVDPASAVSSLAESGSRSGGVLARLREAMVPGELEEGPEPGSWRRQRLAVRRYDRLFADILVTIRGSEADWRLLDGVVRIARLENGRIHGLHVIDNPAQKEGLLAQKVRQVFERRVLNAEIDGDLQVMAGNVVDTILRRASWADLVVVNLKKPPGGDQPLARLGSKFIQLVQRCPRPILAVPNGRIPLLDKALLAYDGSPKADEALFVATYVAARWGMHLTVVTVETEYTSPEALERARSYLELHGVTAEYVLRQKPIAQAVLETAETHQSHLLIMGGFGFRPVLHLVLGSTVDHVLRAFRYPVLICR